MSLLVPCPAVSTEPELGALTEVALAGLLTNHLLIHPAFSWLDYYLDRQNCHSAPWVVPCPASRSEPKLQGSSRPDLLTRISGHLKAAHPGFTWPSGYVHENCHSSPVPVPPGR